VGVEGALVVIDGWAKVLNNGLYRASGEGGLGSYNIRRLISSEATLSTLPLPAEKLKDSSTSTGASEQVLSKTAIAHSQS
jgi:hypothetical protein